MAVVLESFEGLAAGDNIADVGFSFFMPGTTGVFEFDSGLRLISPIPNDDPLVGALVGDFTISGDPTWQVRDNTSAGDVLSSLVVPHAKAYMGRNDGSDGTLTFGFDTSVFGVGALVNAGGKVTVAAYGANGKLIAGARINEVAAEGWKDNLLVVSSKKPIAKVVYTGDFLILDHVTFDTEKFGLVNGTKGNDKIGPGNGGTDNTNDMVYAKKGNDKVFADDGADMVDGGAGKDKLHGGLGNDTLIGGLDKDKLWGDAGQDSFLFTSRNSVDTIKDFNVTEDNILLSQKAFAGLALGTLAPGQLDSTASTPDVRIIYEAASGRLLFDSDGNGGDQAVQFAKLAPNLMLSSQLFFVV